MSTKVLLALRLGTRKVPYFNLTLRPSQYLLRNFSDEKPKDTNLYDSLGIKSSASPAEIKKAYYDLSFKYHPDRNEESVEASNKFREVTQAYEILGNYGLRKRYDKGLPLPDRNNTTERKPVTDTPVKYQSFYDGRTASQKDKSDFRGIGNEDPLSDLGISSKRTGREKMLDNKFNESAKQSWLVGFFIIFLLILVKFYNK